LTILRKEIEMGLAERRIQENFTKNEVPETLKQYSEKTGGATDKVKVEVDWASLGEDKANYDGLGYWVQTLQGVEAVCSDDMGRDAVKSALKKIVIKNVADPKDIRAEFKGGVLTGYLQLSQGASGTPGWTEFQKVLEQAL